MRKANLVTFVNRKVVNIAKYKVDAGMKLCISCRYYVTRNECSACKLIEFHENEGMVYVFHLRNHHYILEVDKKSHDKFMAKNVKEIQIYLQRNCKSGERLTR